MGTTLTGTQIQNTYDGLIKTTDNTAITATTKLISDGLGNDTCIKVGTAGTDFLGAVDFSAATVTGLPGGAAGLESGTGVDSMQSAASLTTVAANASGVCSIALGDGAVGTDLSVAIGKGATSAPSGGNVSLGWNTQACGAGSNIAIGVNACTAFLSENIAIGANSYASGNGGVISIGKDARSGNGLIGVVSIGNGTCANGNSSTVVGANARVCGVNDAAVFGASSQAWSTGSTAVGIAAKSCAVNSVALGYVVTAFRADTVTGCQYEACVAGKGIVVTSPDGLTTLGIGIDNTGAIVTYTP